ncbi:hypothetical protein SUGI_0619960 [Cryptomeria japonica]|nr:hypothetical protein SUGI_0619960 [Cryptomeria japonica]
MEADAIISKVEGSNVAGLYSELRSYLEPLNGLLEFEGRKRALESTVQIHGLAKRYVPFLGRLLKVSCNNLTKGISTSETEQKRADELFRALKLVLDCLNGLRPCLVGNPHEIEVHRHWMVRRLMAWKRFTEAREECWITLHSLKVNAFCKGEKGKTGENENYGVDLYCELADAGLVGLVLGLVTDLIICTGESKLKEAAEYLKVLMLIDQLVPWQRVSDKNTIEKHRSMLYKGLHKCVLFMASEPSNFDSELTRTFVSLALDNCACSSAKDQFVKVAYNICCQLVSGGPDHSSMVADICKLALSTIFKGLQQWQLYGENEIINFLEFYCHHCETSSKLSKDAKQFLHAIANTCGQGSSFSLPAVFHIYGVGMGFKDFEASEDGRSLISIFKALEFLLKASARCVQQEWDFFGANAMKCRPSAWFSSLEQAFRIFSNLFFAVIGCDCIPLEEKKELSRGRQTVVLAATVALKLALMHQKSSQF